MDSKFLVDDEVVEKPTFIEEILRNLLPEVRLFNDYGSTEAIGSAFFEWSAFQPKGGCVGKESIHSKIIFLNDDGDVIKDVGPEHSGTIATEGGTLMSGYDNEPDLTDALLRNGRVISNDIGYRGMDGMIYVLGRRDDLIVCGGNKISPHEIENIIFDLDEVKECCVVPRHDKAMGEMPALFIVWAHEEIDKFELLRYLEKRLEKFKMPRPENIFSIDRLPRTEGTGKIKRNELKEMLNNDNE